MPLKISTQAFNILITLLPFLITCYYTLLHVITAYYESLGESIRFDNFEISTQTSQVATLGFKII